MEIVVIYRADGTLQCLDVAPIPLSHDEALLKKIGVKTIFGSKNLRGPELVPDCCGCPTGMVNAFAISSEDWQALKDGIVGTLGFALWMGAPLPHLGWGVENKVHSEPMLLADTPSLCSMPVLIRELYGRPCRCYRRGDALTKDYRPERVNIEKDDDDRITKIWLG